MARRSQKVASQVQASVLDNEVLRLPTGEVLDHPDAGGGSDVLVVAGKEGLR